MMSKFKLERLWMAGAIAAILALLPGSASATEFGFTGVVQNLGNLGNPGSVIFGDSGALGVNDSSHFDYIFSFTLTNTARIDASVISDGTDFAELHAVIYDADPSSQDLFTNGDPGITGGAGNTNLIDIGASVAGFLTGGSSNGNAAGAGLASLAGGSYYLRIFGVPIGAIGHFSGQIFASAVAATTPIPAALPLFLSALGALGFAARQRRAL